MILFLLYFLFRSFSLFVCVWESVLVYFNFFCLQIVILAMSMAAFVYRTYNQVHILSVYLSIYLRIYLCTHAHSIWEYACRDGGRLFIYYFYSLWLFSLIVVCVWVCGWWTRSFVYYFNIVVVFCVLLFLTLFFKCDVCSFIIISKSLEWIVAKVTQNENTVSVTAKKEPCNVRINKLCVYTHTHT